VLALSGLSTLDESLDLPGSGSTERVGKLEGPKEVVDLLEAVKEKPRITSTTRNQRVVLTISI